MNDLIGAQRGASVGWIHVMGNILTPSCFIIGAAVLIGQFIEFAMDMRQPP